MNSIERILTAINKNDNSLLPDKVPTNSIEKILYYIAAKGVSGGTGTSYDDTQLKASISTLENDKQDKTDNTLTTNEKTVVGAINEIVNILANAISVSNTINNWSFTDLTKIPTMNSLKNGISNTIDSNSKETDLVSAKAVYEKTKNMCKTSVGDVPVTNIAPADTTTFINFNGNASCNYCVRNGICYVSIWSVKIASKGKTLRTGVFLPKCANSRAGTLMTGNADATCHAYVYISSNTGELLFDVKDANIELYGSFPYPVRES